LDESIDFNILHDKTSELNVGVFLNKFQKVLEGGMPKELSVNSLDLVIDCW